MTLYFRDTSEIERYICDVDKKEDASTHIKKFLDEHNYKSYYTIGNLYEDRIEFDVGSHTEFFILYY